MIDGKIEYRRSQLLFTDEWQFFGIDVAQRWMDGQYTIHEFRYRNMFGQFYLEVQKQRYARILCVVKIAIIEKNICLRKTFNCIQIISKPQRKPILPCNFRYIFFLNEPFETSGVV